MHGEGSSLPFGRIPDKATPSTWAGMLMHINVLIYSAALYKNSATRTATEEYATMGGKAKARAECQQPTVKVFNELNDNEVMNVAAV